MPDDDEGYRPRSGETHNVRILDEGLNAAVHLSHRYLAGRQLPDKAVSVLDTACARLALGQSATPPAIEDCVRQIDDLAVQQRILEREAAVGADHRERLGEIALQKAETESRLAGLRARFEKERELVTRIRDLRSASRLGARASRPPVWRLHRPRAALHAVMARAVTEPAPPLPHRL